MSLAQAYMIINFDQLYMNGVDPSVLLDKNEGKPTKESDFIEMEGISFSVMDSIKERIKNE